jgi:glutamyl-tRNA reductase
MQKRPSRPMMVLDIAVPRDVETTVEQIPGVTRCDIDDLQMVAGNSTLLRRQQIPHVEEIVEIENDRFLQWFRSIGVEDTICSLRRKADEIRDSELARLSSLLPELDQESWQVVEKFADSLVNKLLHDPTVQMRESQGTRDGVDHGEAVRKLFRLETQLARAAHEADR